MSTNCVDDSTSSTTGRICSLFNCRTADNPFLKFGGLTEVASICDAHALCGPALVLPLPGQPGRSIVALQCESDRKILKNARKFIGAAPGGCQTQKTEMSFHPGSTFGRAFYNRDNRPGFNVFRCLAQGPINRNKRFF